MDDLKKNVQGFLISDTHRECTNRRCGVIFKKTSKTVTICPKCNSERVKSNDPIRKMVFRARSRAKARGVECNIDFDDIKIPTHCPILGIELKCHVGRPGGEIHSPALDRIDNSKGYIKGNVIVISHLANAMKSSANPEQLINFAKWVKKEFPGQL